jgi:hypothetical protein
MVCVNNVVVYYSSNALFRPISDTAACIGLLLCFWQNFGGAIITVDGGVSSVTITGSEFKRNTANGGNAEYGDNIYKQSLGDLTCDDGTNTFNNPGGNYPVDLCAS